MGFAVPMSTTTSMSMKIIGHLQLGEIATEKIGDGGAHHQMCRGQCANEEKSIWARGFSVCKKNAKNCFSSYEAHTWGIWSTHGYNNCLLYTSDAADE